MFMQTKIVISILFLFIMSVPAAAAECTSELHGITAYFLSRGDQWSLSWDAAGVHKRKIPYYVNRNERIRTNVHESWRSLYEDSENLPQHLLAPDVPVDGRSGIEQPNECEKKLTPKFNVPFAVAKSGEFLIAAIYEDGNTSWASKQFAIVDLKKQEIVKIIKTENKVISLAWAPDSKSFAVLYEQDVTENVFKVPVDWLAALVGHPIGYWTFYLTVYRPDGVELCSKQIEKKLPNAMSYIDWE